MDISKLQSIRLDQPSPFRVRELLSGWGRWAFQRPEGWYSDKNPIYRFIDENDTTKVRKHKNKLPPENELMAIDMTIAHLGTCRAYHRYIRIVCLRHLLGLSEREIAKREGISRITVRKSYGEAVTAIGGAYPIHMAKLKLELS